MIVVICTSLLKTFFFMRIFVSFSYIVTMIREVIKDLRTFIVFFIIVILSFSNILDVVGHSTNQEYETIGPLWGNLFATLRLSLGDFDFSQIQSLPSELCPDQDGAVESDKPQEDGVRHAMESTLALQHRELLETDVVFDADPFADHVHLRGEVAP